MKQVGPKRVSADKAGAILAAEVISDGGIVVYPTDTTYAIGANALDFKAVESVLGLKGRPASKAMSVVLADIANISAYALVRESALNLAHTLLPGPVTLLFKAKPGSVELACSADSVGIRIPNSRFCTQFASIAGVPVTATSANLSGANESYSIEDVVASFGSEISQVGLLVDGGQLENRGPSTILDLSGPDVKLVREGALTSQQLRALIGSC